MIATHGDIATRMLFRHAGLDSDTVLGLKNKSAYDGILNSAMDFLLLSKSLELQLTSFTKEVNVTKKMRGSTTTAT